MTRFQIEKLWEEKRFKLIIAWEEAFKDDFRARHAREATDDEVDEAWRQLDFDKWMADYLAINEENAS